MPPVVFFLRFMVQAFGLFGSSGYATAVCGDRREVLVGWVFGYQRLDAKILESPYGFPLAHQTASPCARNYEYAFAAVPWVGEVDPRLCAGAERPRLNAEVADDLSTVRAW